MHTTAAEATTNSGTWKGVAALLLAWLVFAAIARMRWRWKQHRERNPHSPVDAEFLQGWITLLVRGDTDPDTDTEPDPVPGRGHKIVQVDENRYHVEYFDRAEDELPPATPSPGRANSQLHVWIRRSYEQGAKYSDIVREGQTLFGKSEATIKRAIRDYQQAQKRTRAGR